MTESKKPEFREDDSWFSKEQLEKLTPADHADREPLPIPTQMVSNGEYMPYPQTEKQKQVEARINQLADDASKKLGMTRRQFLASSGGMAASFLAMNEVFGHFFDIRPVDMFVPAAYAESGTPPNLFVLDTQLHTIRSSRNFNNLTLRAIAQGVHSALNALDLPDELGGVNTPWNPALRGLPNVSENFYLVQFVKDVYLDSPMRTWTLDDPVVADPMYDLIVRNGHMRKTHPGFFNICIHKGLSTNASNDPSSEPLGFPTDIPRAAKNWPMLNFIIYHSCIRPGFWMLNALNDVHSGRLRAGVPDILWTTQFAVDSAP